MPCEFYLQPQINSVDGIPVLPDSSLTSSEYVDYSKLSLKEIIWLQQQDDQANGDFNEGRYCPRGLESQGAQPDGVTPCEFFDRDACGHAFSEYADCPTVRRREANDLSAYGDVGYWQP